MSVMSVVRVYLGTNNVANSLWHVLEADRILQLLRNVSMFNLEASYKPVEERDRSVWQMHEGGGGGVDIVWKLGVLGSVTAYSLFPVVFRREEVTDHDEKLSHVLLQCVDDSVRARIKRVGNLDQNNASLIMG